MAGALRRASWSVRLVGEAQVQSVQEWYEPFEVPVCGPQGGVVGMRGDGNLKVGER